MWMLRSYLCILLASFNLSQSNDDTLIQSKLLAFRVSKYSSFFPYTCSDYMLIPELSEGTPVTIRIVGHLADVTEAALTSSEDNCESVYPETVVSMERESDEVGSIALTTPTNLGQKKATLYFCFRAGPHYGWVHQGIGYWGKLIVVQRYTTVFAIVVGCALSIFFAAILNTSLLSLMSLDMVELKARADTGTERERMICRALMGLRKRGHLIVVAIIPAIVFFKTAVTVFLRILFNGWVAILLSTVIIVLIVEIVPRIRKRSKKSNASADVHAEPSIRSKCIDDDPGE